MGAAPADAAAASAMPSSLTKDAKTVIVDTEHIVFSALLLAEGCIKFVLMLVVFSSLFAFLILTGVALVAIRRAFLWMLPFLIRHGDVVVAGINIMLDLLQVFSVAVIAGIDLAIAAADLFGAGIDVIEPLDFGQLSVEAYKSAMNNIATTCGPYTDVWSVWSLTAAPVLSSHVCPYARAVYPVAGETLTAFEGFVTVESDPYGNNCEVELPPDFAMVCTGMSAGYIILEALVPLLLVCFFFYAAGHALLKIVWAASSMVLYVVIRSTDAVIHILYAAEKEVTSVAAPPEYDFTEKTMLGAGP